MQCEKCKIKRATVFYTELDRTRHAMCTSCAAESKGGSSNTGKDLFIPYAPSTYMYELVHNTNRIYYTNDLKDTSLSCSACGTEIADALRSGQMGCPECYKSFNGVGQFSDLRQASYSHFNSRIPRRYAIRKETEKLIESLRQKMNLAIQSENFEYAAKMRDEIKALSIAQKGI